MTSQVISGIKETAQSITSAARPWGDFLDLSAFSFPSSIADATTRLTQNSTHFIINYGIILCTLLAVTLITRPIAILAFIAVGLAWFFLYFAREEPLTIFGFTVDDGVVVLLLIGLSIASLISTRVWLKVLHSIAVPATVQERPQRQKVETLPRKVAIEFGEPGSSDAKVILVGKQGFCVKLSVHKKVLVDHSSFFAKKLAEKDSVFACLEIESCEDAEIYVETIGLMYCKDMKQRMMKQNVSRVLCVLKVAELLGFSSCIQSCLDYIEAVPWVGEEEEEKVISGGGGGELTGGGGE